MNTSYTLDLLAPKASTASRHDADELAPDSAPTVLPSFGSQDSRAALTALPAPPLVPLLSIFELSVVGARPAGPLARHSAKLRAVRFGGTFPSSVPPPPFRHAA